jgi:hypothetical protein
VDKHGQAEVRCSAASGLRSSRSVRTGRISSSCLRTGVFIHAMRPSTSSSTVFSRLRKIEINDQIQRRVGCPDLRQKISCFRFSEFCDCLRVSRAPKRGASRSSRVLARDAMDVAAREANAPKRTAKSCGPGAPGLALSARDDDLAATVTKRSWTPGRARSSR